MYEDEAAFIQVETTQHTMLLNVAEISTAKQVFDDCPKRKSSDGPTTVERTWVTMRNGEGVRVELAFSEFFGVLDGALRG